ncbi:MAG: NAD-dependent epimerase/dehydratase family protein [Bacteroidota bacterium]
MQNSESSKYSASIIGASGLIGSQVLNLLLADTRCERVSIFVRKPMPVQHAKLSQHVINFDDEKTWAHLVNTSHLFSCLGTTKDQVKSEAEYRKIDYDYPVHFANAGLKNGLEQILLISSAGADTKSSVFYLRLKGELEESMKKLPLQGLHIFRPSVLIGERKNSRFGEWFFTVIKFLFIGPIRQYKPVDSLKVAQMMVATAAKSEKGIHLYNNTDILDFNRLSCFRTMLILL